VAPIVTGHCSRQVSDLGDGIQFWAYLLMRRGRQTRVCTVTMGLDRETWNWLHVRYF